MENEKELLDDIYLGEAICDFEEMYEVELTDAAKKRFADWLKEYGAKELKKAVFIAIEKYDDAIDSFNKIGGILYNRAIKKELLFKSREGE